MSEAEVELLDDKWKQLFSALTTNESEEIKKLSLNKLYCSFCDSTEKIFDKNVIVTVDTFISLANRHLYKSNVWSSITTAEQYILGCTKFMVRLPSTVVARKMKKHFVYDVSFHVVLPETCKSRCRNYHQFKFVKEKGVFKFYGFESN
jgi:hypothetical protein